MALILLNYRYSPTGRIGVNTSIRLRLTLPHNGLIPRKKLQWSRIGVFRLCRYDSGVRSTPMSSLTDWNRYIGRLFIITSATLSALETFSRLSFPRVTHSRTKWYWTSICFDALWCTGLRAKPTAPCLSLKTTGVQVGSDCRNVTTSLLSHKASLAASDSATYSASVVDIVVQS